ncbi:MAG: hypothetical protein QM775_13270 [Pirellulales bacterium]
MTSALNTYDGVTAIRAGVLELTSGAKLGSSAVFVNGGALSIVSASQLGVGTLPGGLNLVGQLGTSVYSLPVVANNNFVIDASNPLNLNVPISGMILGVDGTTGTASTISADIDLSQISGGGNRVWLGNVIGFDRTYTGQLRPAADGNWRVTSGSNNLIIGVAGVGGFTGGGVNSLLIAGLDHANAAVFAGSAITNATSGTVSVRSNNNSVSGVVVNRGVTLNINSTGMATGTMLSPLGSGDVVSLGGTISTDNTSDAQFGNTNFMLFGGATLLLDNAGVTTDNTNRRLQSSSSVMLASSTLRLQGDGGAAVKSIQQLTQISYAGGSTISIDTDGTTANRTTVLNPTGFGGAVQPFVRLGRGTVNFRNSTTNATTFGTSAGTQKFIIGGSSPYPTPVNDMLGAELVLWGGTTFNDASLPLFVTHDTTAGTPNVDNHGLLAATFDVTATTAAQLATATPTSIVDISGQTANMTVTTASVQALRIRTTANTNQSVNSGTITIGASAGVNQGAGLFLAHTANNGVTHTTNFAFGSQEGLIYAATTGGTSGSITLSGVLSGTNGVTRFGDGILILTGANTFTGTFTNNAGETRIGQGAINSSAAASGSINPASPTTVDLWGGSFYYQTATVRYNNNIVFSGDARFGNANVVSTGFNNLIVEARSTTISGLATPVVAWFQNQSGTNLNVAYGGLTLNGPAQFAVAHVLQINGAISGVGTLEKYLNERMMIGGDSSAYSQAVTVHAGALYSLNANSTAKPFGTGAITVNPGSTIQLASPNNVGTGQLTINSDWGGISGVTLPFTYDVSTLPITVNSTASAWKGYLGVSGPAFDYNLDQSASGLWGGGVYLGAGIGLTGTYTGTLTPTASGQFLLGTGQGAIRIARPLTGANSAVIGVSMTGLGRADQIVNNSGGAVNYDVPMTYTGTTIIHPNISLRLAADNALNGTGDIVLNGGTLRHDTNVGQLRTLAPMVVSNAIILTADSSITMDDNASDFVLGGNISLAPGSTGVVRQLTVNAAQTGGAANNAGMLYLNGGISDGAGGSGNHFIKAGLGVAMVTGPMTYTGTTTVTGGLLGINSDADLAASSQIILTGGGVAVWENSFTTNRNYSVHGANGYFDIAGGLTLTQSAASTIDGNNFIIKRGLGTLILNGNNSQIGLFLGDGILQLNSQAAMGSASDAQANSIQFGGDLTLGVHGTATRYTGGTLRINATMATNRGLLFNNNGNTTFSGGVDVTAGNTFTVNGVVAQGTEFDFAMKTGLGTMITTGANTARQLAMINGVWQFANSTPWANSTATAADNTVLEMLGGTIRAVNTTANIALTNAASTTTYNYGGGMHLLMESGAGFSVEFAADSLIRQNQGTLVLETAGGTVLGGAGNSNAARAIVTNAVNASTARASALNNGIFAPHLLGADAAGTAFFLQDNATTGFVAYSGATTATLSGTAPTAIGEITTTQSLSGSNSIYAFRTTADVNGSGFLRITAIDNTRTGGLIFNGSNTFSAGLLFDIASATAPGTGTLGEGLIYVKTGETASISGSILAGALTKFGRGTLVLSGSNRITSDVSVQDGILRLAGSNPFSRLDTELNINAGATVDLNGTSIALETLGANNRTIGGADAGGAIVNTAATQAVLGVVSPVNSSARVTIAGDVKLLKAGAGVLTLNGYNAATPDAGNNTFTGGTDIYGVNQTGGINLNNTTFALGGFGGAAAGDVNLYGGTLGLLFSNGTTGINGTNGQQFNNQIVKFGAEASLGLTVNLRGPGQINVNQATPSNNTGFGQGNLMQIGALNLSNNTLNVSGGSLYRLRVAGTTTIQGSQATFQINNESLTVQLDGLVTGAGAINKLGDGAQRTLVFNNVANNFSGGLNIQAGDVQNLNPTQNTLGLGAVRVFPEGTLRISGNGSVIGANLQVLSRVNALGAVALDENFSPTVLTSANFASVYHTTLQLAQPYFNQALNLATIGDGRAFLGSAINSEVKYMAATLGAGVADDWNPGVGVYRLVGGVNNLGFDGVDNVFTGTAYMQVGPRRNNALGAATNTGNAVIIRNSNNFTGGTQITEGTLVVSEVGGSPVGETPLGSGAIEVYGEYRIQGSLGSNWKADAGAATNNVVLRPGGLVRLIDGNALGTGGNFAAGNQGRWGDSVGIDLNGGQFRLDGAANWNTVETIGAVTVRKGGVLTVARNSAVASALN